jgi:hypothetical protein
MACSATDFDGVRSNGTADVAPSVGRVCRTMHSLRIDCAGLDNRKMPVLGLS